MKYARVFADSQGESHFEDIEVLLTLVEFAPPAPPLLLSAFTPARQTAFLVAPVGWFGDWHPVPQRQWFFFLTGELEVAVSDGGRRRFTAGSVVLFEDIEGRGHTSQNVGEEEVVPMIAQLSDE